MQQVLVQIANPPNYQVHKNNSQYLQENFKFLKLFGQNNHVG